MERSSYIIEFIDQKAIEQFKSLPASVQKTLGKAIRERLEVDPIAFGKPLQYSLKGHRRLRVGNYRIVYKIDHEKKIVIILVVDHRKDVYEEYL